MRGLTKPKRISSRGKTSLTTKGSLYKKGSVKSFRRRRK